MKILFVEDTPSQAQFMRKGLENRYPEAEIQRITTELEFRQQFDSIVAAPPDIFIIDVMLKWTQPSEDMEVAPPDALGKVHEAGLRCARMLLKAPSTAKLPMILYTVLDEEDLEEAFGARPRNISYLPKQTDHEDLCRKIDEAVKAR